MSKNDEQQDLPIDHNLPDDIMTWLKKNTSFTKHDRIREVQGMLLKRAAFKQIVFYAAECFLLLENQELIRKSFADYDNTLAKNLVMTTTNETQRIKVLEKAKRSKDGRKGGVEPKRPDITKEILDSHREEYYAQNGRYHGWIKVTALALNTSADTIRNRMDGQKK